METSGRKLFEASTKKLKEALCDCDSDGLQDFLKVLNDHAKQFGWLTNATGILKTPVDVTHLNQGHTNLIEECGTVEMERITACENAHRNLHDRRAQDTHMLHLCLRASLSDIGRAKVDVCVDEFHVGDEPSGPMLLKVIIRESHTDDDATTNLIRTELSSLDECIHTIGNDVIKLNNHVKVLVEKLHAR